MVKIDNLNNPAETHSSQTSGFETKTNPNSQTPTQKSGLLAIVGQLLPLAPFVYEQFTGQKVPAMTGTMAEMQTTLLQIQTNLQTIANHQQSLNQRLMSLENTAQTQLTNLTHQFNSLRLTHTREKKQIEYGPNSSREEENPDY